MNTIAAVAAAAAIGISAVDALHHMESFEGVKRRLELRGTEDGVKVIDDFAHHPTAIEETLKAQKKRPEGGKNHCGA